MRKPPKPKHFIKIPIDYIPIDELAELIVLTAWWQNNEWRAELRKYLDAVCGQKETDAAIESAREKKRETRGRN